MLGLALAMLGVAMVAVRHGYARHGLGGATGVAAAVVSLILWLDAYTVSQSQLGDCDGIGLSGPASVAVNRAGWLLFASVLLSLATATWFQGGAREWFR
jgi:drug/metabolite transporter (DMT)-like permease